MFPGLWNIVVKAQDGRPEGPGSQLYTIMLMIIRLLISTKILIF